MVRKYAIPILLILPALILFAAFWTFASWNLERQGYQSYHNLRALPGWELHIGDLAFKGGLPDRNAAEQWEPLDSQSSETAQIPSGYRGYYWMRVQLPETLREEEGRHILVRGIKHVQLFTDQRKVFEFNMEKRDFKVNVDFYWSLASLKEQDFGHTLYIREYQSGGPPRLGTFLLGPAYKFILETLWIDAFRIVLCILYMILSVSAFVLFAFHRKDRAYFFFAILTACITYGSIVTARSHVLFVDLPLFSYLHHIGIPLGTGALFGFMSELLTGRRAVILRTFLWIQWGLFAAVVWAAMTDERWYLFGMLRVYPPITGMMMIVLFAFIAQSLRRRRDNDLLWILAGLILLILSLVLHFVQIYVDAYRYWLFRLSPTFASSIEGSHIIFGGFLFVVCLGAVLVRRYTATHRQVAQYAGELEAKNEQLREMDRLKDDFLANTSHELRTPLYGIIGMAETLLDENGTAEGRAGRNRLEIIIASCKRLIRLVSDILDLARLSHNDLKLDLRPVDIRQSAEIVTALLTPQAKMKNLALRNDFPTELRPVRADEDRVQQILFNLVGNALKFTAEGSVTLACRPAVTPDGREALEISISDTGLGIPPEDLSRIFEKFHQSSRTIEQGLGGTGLGLTVSKRLIELQGGQLSVTSEVDRGSTFRFTLPVWQEEIHGFDPDLASRQAASASVAPSLLQPPVLRTAETEDNEPRTLISHAPETKERLILVVDDEPVNLEVLASHLCPPYRVVTHHQAAKALDWIKGGGKPDLVITDVMMPGMNGYELAKQLRGLYGEADMPILMLSAKSMPEDLTEGFESGANDYVVKPVTKRELLSRVKLHLKMAELNRSLEEEVRERTAELEKRNLELQYSIRETLEAMKEIVALEERNRIAHEIHDTVGHALTATIFQLEATKKLLEKDRELALEKLASAQTLIRNGLQQVRTAVRVVKEDSAKSDLNESLVQLITETENAAGVEIGYSIPPLSGLSPLQKKVVYHALQEGLTNGLRHGGGTKFRFELEVKEGWLQFTLKNNGQPFHDSRFGFGLTAMKERVVTLGGTLAVEESADWGCVLTLRLPVAS
ncbi:ATP-binding protein [Cohnella sp. CFH 77786]|uniref:ATP-binding protein n=1 Tax=Cohnella sp. CFH 77786 TaxID=2662265 RepID=UPI001C60C118